ncbi:2-oxoglutarate dehydrogenase E1 component [Pseudoalteromonas sp. THAF3]|uniref:2-oxoglutarate dehydrogenase E1 component n=1 Tax=Pseudoalteromonas TaxID=53246 RepID=UPI0006B44646|nr:MULTISPECIES: 2-oxoglutarate dehydrogenase E1 component [Pseudoalteromonas]MCG7564969.1 2-oxoglutarate dehydrogenase E1 component [Pseudoalteromonas sp. CnMc7-15]MCG7568711.1 2-oxoglutarate dehydrogenase E1 component [Pseudoalteromonas sp. CNC9-20]QFU04935.1 2-oxoglutarate dehydrogenase E1 component [Pseudoalteromonas sp. THAF3]TMO47194.1 2-oxoglutarate dehydrogenase E1 component [Pseudoalteromonas ruthenica]TMO51368.1 2-oxoglutarate dehydrogenase E1 component [Pseudoalteromonas ruthenica]|tara:strand:- start:19926 stop:22739 length:2814 start_codon:yes stop_codon:yes gene_type:complete
MHDGVMKAWLESSHLYGGNVAYVEELYEAYLDDVTSVPEEWREVFEQLPKVEGVDVETKHSQVRAEFAKLAKNKHREVVVAEGGQGDPKQIKVLQLINAFRFRGHQNANLDPLGIWKRERVRDLELDFHGLSEDDFDTEFYVGSFAAGGEMMKLGDLYKALKATYCGSIGAEYMHITSTEEKRWLQQRLESVQARPQFDSKTKQRILKGLIAADGLEKYLGSKFPGAKRFSLEGGDALVPMLKELIHRAGESGQQEAVIGMAHRGRLNVLVNVLGKNPSALFDEFAGKHDDTLGSGDVKYHMGYSSDFATEGGSVHMALAFNPSHLEIVNPVVMGSVRARLDRLECESGSKALPITIHGDSAIAGQGCVQETFNMSQTNAFKVGGSVRIVVNNQVGFTTSKQDDTRSTDYCTDIAKMVQSPIFHVNSDDPEAVALVTQIALDFRNQFKRDVVIDLVCYRRHGHNEADEPSATQPLMYKKIKKHPVPRQIYADQLVSEGVLSEKEIKKLADDYRNGLDEGNCVVEEIEPETKHSSDWSKFVGHDWDTEYETHIPVEKLKELGEKVASYPEEHKAQSRVKKIYDDRKAMAAGEKKLDWGMAETLAYATMVEQGTDIRLTGQDSGRGTFFHRHAVVHNQEDASTYLPLQHIKEDQGKFEVYDSVLSEEAVLAFEYGYATAEPTSLVMWEAQFGDFANGAQVVFDQFLSSGEQKWGRLCGLTCLLPHGYEGQGPEHSSARLERFLQLCADHNMQVCVPSTPAQVYAMLRRQSVRPLRRPLIVMTPKSLLRHPLAVSTLEELSEGVFHNMIDEIDDIDAKNVERVVFCSGKVYYELLQERRKQELDNIAIVRVEQLYPFPHQEMADIIERYSHVKDFVWCQEEPQNQGAWYCSQHHFWQAIPQGANLTYAGRNASASPACGYMSVHTKEQQALVADALTIKK